MSTTREIKNLCQATAYSNGGLKIINCGKRVWQRHRHVAVLRFFFRSYEIAGFFKYP